MTGSLTSTLETRTQSLPMIYFTARFTPQNWSAFLATDGTLLRFPVSPKHDLTVVEPGDRFLCFLAAVSRFAGVLEAVAPGRNAKRVSSGARDYADLEVFPIQVLELDDAIPIQAFETSLPWFRGDRNRGWRKPLGRSLRPLDRSCGEQIQDMLLKASRGVAAYPLSAAETARMRRCNPVPSAQPSTAMPTRPVIEPLPTAEATAILKKLYRGIAWEDVLERIEEADREERELIEAREAVRIAARKALEGRFSS